MSGPRALAPAAAMTAPLAWTVRSAKLFRAASQSDDWQSAKNFSREEKRNQLVSYVAKLRFDLRGFGRAHTYRWASLGQVRKFGAEMASPYSGPQPFRIIVLYNLPEAAVQSGAGEGRR